MDLPYNGLALDRAAGRRGDEAWLRGLRERQDSLVIPLWRDQCLVSGPAGELVTIAMAEAAAALDESAVPGGRAAPVFLGLRNDVAAASPVYRPGREGSKAAHWQPAGPARA